MTTLKFKTFKIYFNDNINVHSIIVKYFTKKMDSSPLDYVAQECMDLTEALSTANESERDSLIDNHLTKVYSAGSPVKDFKKNLEWVNVSQPLSLAENCHEKIVVLDFWTYCCINCYHILPDLAHIEKLYPVEDGLVVIGVHCAKFTNEKHSENILAAVKRYNIKHPVVNDAESSTWDTLGIRCWPTLLILGPSNIPLFVLTGEGHRDELVWFVSSALRHFSSKVSKTSLPISLNTHVQSAPSSVLNFPGKIALNPFYRGRADEPFLAISDTGNHRILLTDCSGKIQKSIGGSGPGFKDGKLEEALFHSPQGLCWLSHSVLAVCDTDNHAVRTVHLDENSVEVLAGTGKQADYGDNGGKCLGMQALSSPWDILLFTTPDMDMSVRSALPLSGTSDKSENSTETTAESEKNDEKRRVLLVACAGSHQIWAIFLDTTIWWKYKTYSEGTCVCIAGSGKEAARNSMYPNTAAFAQPSGLALKSGSFPELFIADSESSSIRKLSLSTGQVLGVAGGDRNPLNLFAYGIVDDVGFDAKFQHPLGLTYCEGLKSLYVADTYNNKIRKVDVLSHRVTTLKCMKVDTTVPAKFNEPSDIAITNDGKYLYVVDTNNHAIKIINIVKNVCQDFNVHYYVEFKEPDNLIIYNNDLFVNRKCGSLIIHFNICLEPTELRNIKVTPGAPQLWSMCIRDESGCDVTHKDFEYVNCSHKGTHLPGRIEMKLKERTDKTHYKMYLSIDTALCEGSVCFTHSFVVRSMILVRDSVKAVESYKMTCKVNTINFRP